MFSLQNMYTKDNITILVQHKEQTLTFTLTSLISKRNKSELNEQLQFLLLNSYLDYKGDEFKEKVFNELYKANNLVEEWGYIKGIAKKDDNNEVVTKGGLPLPCYIINPILNLFDLQDIFNYLKEIYKLQPPKNLAVEFNPMIEKDARGSRVQTYLKDDYLELAAMILIIKVAMCPIFQFAYYKQKELGTIYKEYLLLHLFMEHPIFNCPPMQKLLGLIEKLIEQTTTDDNTVNARKLEKMLPQEEIPYYILGVILIQKISIATLVDDNADKNIITKVYNYVNNKLKNTGDVSKSIRNKTIMKDIESPNEDNESLIESYRSQEKISVSTIVEFDWAVNSIDKIIYMLTPEQQSKINFEILEDAKEFCKTLLNHSITKTQLIFLSILFKSVIDPRALEYIKLENIYNLLVVGFTYLWGIDCKKIALLLVSIVDNNISDMFYVNTTSNKSRLSKEMKDKLDNLYPYKRIINNTTSNNIVEESINDLTSEIYTKKWIPVAYEKYIIDVLGDTDLSKLIDSELKITICNFIIVNEEVLNATI